MNIFSNKMIKVPVFTGAPEQNVKEVHTGKNFVSLYQ